MQLRSIQALRGLAAVLVTLSHLHGIETRYSEEAPILSSAWMFGVSGVDLFFVISGFIMVWVAGDIAASGRQTGAFLFARVCRIFPVWWLFLGLMSLYFFITYGTPWDQDVLTRHQISGAEHLLKSIFLIPHEALPVLQLGWTLVHEMYFYVVFALILLLPTRFRVPAFAAWAAVIAASIYFQLTGFYADNVVSLALFPMTLEFLMGVAVGLVIKRGITSYHWIAFATGLFWLIAAGVHVDFLSLNQQLPTVRTLAFGPAFALILYGLVAMEQREQFVARIPNALVTLGDWSYSLYLCHLLVISAVARVFFPIFGGAGYVDNAAFLLLSIGGAIAVSGLAYRLFEQPVSQHSKALKHRLFLADNSPSPTTNRKF
jgi:exopolysaccharide production protein ExoZ